MAPLGIKDVEGVVVHIGHRLLGVDVMDRIVLNAFFRMGHGPGGFRVWWQALTESEETLDNTHLMRLAGRFSRRVRWS